MLHIFRLQHEPFVKIQNKQKKIEMRIRDDKRRNVRKLDHIRLIDVSNSETLDCLVLNVYVYQSFLELYQHHDKVSLGYDEDEVADPEDVLRYFSKEKLEQYKQVVAIELMVMEMPKIFCDLDGVLADFDRGVKELCHLSLLPMNGTRELDKENEMWHRIKEVGHFYDKLEFMPGSKEMFDLVYHKHPNFVILTGTPKEERGITTAVEDKINWVHRHLSKNIQIIVVDSEEKCRYCTGYDILIDDSKKNISDWIEAGGTGILYESSQTTLEKLIELGIL